MVRLLPACPPQAMLAELIHRKSRPVRAAGSPSPRSQLISTYSVSAKRTPVPGAHWVNRDMLELSRIAKRG
jgi:hypothetical protein